MACVSSARGYAMLADGKFSDFKITCQDKEFHVHRNVLSQTGDFFKVAVGKGFKEGVSGVCDLPEEHSTIVARALVFVYGGEFSDDLSTDHSNICHPRLEPSSASDYDSTTPQPSTSLDISFLTHSFADRYGINSLKDAAYVQFMSRAVDEFATREFSDMLTKVYENTSRDAEGLRLAVTRLCITKHKFIKESPELLRIVQLHEPMAFRCGVQSIKDEDLGSCYNHTSKLKKLAARVKQLTTYINKNNACDGCGAQIAVKMEGREDGGLYIICSDCGLRGTWTV